MEDLFLSWYFKCEGFLLAKKANIYIWDFLSVLNKEKKY